MQLDPAFPTSSQEMPRPLVPDLAWLRKGPVALGPISDAEVALPTLVWGGGEEEGLRKGKVLFVDHAGTRYSASALQDVGSQVWRTPTLPALGRIWRSSRSPSATQHV